jgi:crotonobetaine/carnitine-CoA ligase
MADMVGSQTVADLWAAAIQAAPDRPFLIFLAADGHREEYSYAQCGDWIDRVADALCGLGIGPGDPVVLQLPNGPEFLVGLFALCKLGAISVPVSSGAKPDELNHIYATTDAAWVITDQDHIGEHITTMPHRSPGGLVVAGVDTVNVHPGIQGQPPIYSMRRLATQKGARNNPTPVFDNSTPAEILFTSGTTAQPKGVVISQANLVYSGLYAVWQASLRPDDRLFTTMPACHSNFQLVALTGVLAAQATLIMAERYSASRFWEQVRQEGATVVQLIAMMVRTLLLQPARPEDSEHRVREALYFMPLADRDKTGFEQRFGLRLLNSYGSTESICWALTDPPTGPRNWPSVGRPGLGYEVGIFDDRGRELPCGQTGEIWVRGTPGRSLMSGYWNDPQATAAALQDNWLHTHDYGYRDQDGWFYFVDRAVNIIKRGGENISTRQVEEVLLSHPGIEQAAVIGVPDPVRDQAVKAFVVPIAGARLDPAEIIDFCAAHLSAYKVPQFVEVTDSLPLTHSMKVAKRLLDTSTDAVTPIPHPAENGADSPEQAAGGYPN